MAKDNNRLRTANYTKEECWRLIEVVESYANIIENKKTDALTWKDKKNAWENICKKFNSMGTQNRTWEQLRSKYETLKKETRRAVAKRRTEILGTGGGPCENTINPLYEKIRALIKLSCDGLPSCFDSDYIGLSKEEDSVVVVDVDDQYYLSIICDNDVDSIEADTLPTTSTAHISSQCKANEPADPQPHESPSFIEESTETVNNWTSYSPAQLKKPQHPVLQSQRPRKRPHANVNVSAAGQKMQLCLDSKTELTNLKLKLLQEEFKLRQQREQELHDQQLLINKQLIEINNLKIEKLKEELVILKKTK